LFQRTGRLISFSASHSLSSFSPLLQCNYFCIADSDRRTGLNFHSDENKILSDIQIQSHILHNFLFLSRVQGSEALFGSITGMCSIFKIYTQKPFMDKEINKRILEPCAKFDAKRTCIFNQGQVKKI